MSGKCKAASCENLMSLKRYRVNQHNSAEDFLQRSNVSRFCRFDNRLIYLRYFLCVDVRCRAGSNRLRDNLKTTRHRNARPAVLRDHVSNCGIPPGFLTRKITFDLRLVE
ncbi:hypothetical protein DIE19_12425 [Burkholderia sp. Bp9126]|nr:hypothetical protein DIE19_12425 [Burkholderia sp. Bp9126]